MSGGSRNYICYKLEEECIDMPIEDCELSLMIKDLCKVLHDLEWWESGDYGEEQYQKSLSNFKEKWLRGDKVEIAKDFCDNQISIVKQGLYSILGIKENKE